MRTNLMAVAAMGAVLGMGLHAPAMEPEERQAVIRDGLEILAEGKFAEGLKFFEEYADAYPGDTLLLVWRTKARQFLRYEAQAADNPDPAKRAEAVRKLHDFHMGNGRPDLAEAAERKLFADHPTAAAAAMLAETLMAQKNNEEALRILTSVADPGEDPDYRIMHGLALARTGQAAEAKRAAAGLVGEEKVGKNQARNLALLFGYTDHLAESAKLLAAFFESMGEDEFRETRESIVADAEWAFAKDHEAYAAAWNAKPRGQDCGSDCSSCPSRCN